jgi:hypothetical protein
MLCSWLIKFLAQKRGKGKPGQFKVIPLYDDNERIDRNNGDVT